MSEMSSTTMVLPLPTDGDSTSPRVSPSNFDSKERSRPADNGEGRRQCALRQDMHTFFGPNCENTTGTQPRVDQGRPQELIAEKGRALSQEIQSSDCLLDLDLPQGEAASVHVNDDAFRRPSHHAMSQSTFTEEGGPGPQRAEEVAIQAMKTEFEKAAGYPAAFEEFESHLVYEQKTVADDGETIHLREVLVGTRFTPEPFMRSLRRVVCLVLLQVLYASVLALSMIPMPLALWRTCESEAKALQIMLDYVRTFIGSSSIIVWYLAMIEGHRLERLFRRLQRTWHHFVLFPVCYFAFNALYLEHRLRPYALIFLSLGHVGLGILTPLGFFWQATRDMPNVVKRRWLYVLQMMFILSVSVVGQFFWVGIFLPRGERAATDTARARVAFTCLLACWPLVAVVNGSMRKMKDGPPLYNYSVIYYLCLGSLVVPRLLQAKMVNLSSKIISSFLFALYDLLGDLAVPYADMLHAKIIRILKRTRDNQSAKPAHKTGAFNAIKGRSQHVAESRAGSSETISTGASKSRAAKGEPRRSSSEIYQSVMRAGRMQSRSSGLSSMASVVDLQSNFMAYDVRPSCCLPRCPGCSRGWAGCVSWSPSRWHAKSSCLWWQCGCTTCLFCDARMSLV
ncbi:unnamed protein product [Vitrella brassicaformis CCMP3155]|uniref:Uncharacterized protein n=1 Tax=Vitrella brassicaformis (strain CCMP3155) TaxID=1169540 RepID=A0A0G4ETH7_VITBC|nr:unnamed protein product [Vitrella brassicaformis CCMP3155]|eukprot:CEM01615.1 unnamed protein product [Vitrella brassicaformis CCMP3155]